MSTPLNFTMTCEKELKWIERLSLLLNRNGLCVFRYNSGKDQMAVFGESMIPKKRVRNLTQEIENSETINEEDRRTLLDFFSGKINGSIEIQVVVDGNKICRKAFDALPLQDTDRGDNAEGEILIGCVKDITEEKDRQLHLEEMAKRIRLQSCITVLPEATESTNIWSENSRRHLAV